MSILVADDEAITRKLLQKMLENMGHNVIAAEDGAKAWELFQAQRPQIIISDWVMPNMDGITLCRNIRQLPAENYTYIIIVTSKTKTVDLIKAFTAGANDYILKPFDAEELKVRFSNGERILELENRHKKLQKILKQSRNKLRTVLDGLTDEIAAIDRDNLFVSLNRAAVKALGNDYDSLIHQNFLELNQKLPEPIWGEEIEQLSQRVFNSGKAEFFLDKRKNSTGNMTVKQHSILPIKEEDGRVEQAILVARDVTMNIKVLLKSDS